MEQMDVTTVPTTGESPIGSRRPRDLRARLAFWLYVGYLLLIAVGVWLQRLNGGSDVGGWILAAAVSAFPTLGVVVATRQPGNRIGWVLGLVGIVVVSFDAEQYGRYGVITEPGSLPFVPYVLWVSHWAWLVGIGLVPTFLLLLFPDGRPPSPRWRWVAWLTGIGLALAVLVVAVQPGNLGGGVENPFGWEALAPLYPQLVDYVFLFLSIPVLLCASSLVFRFRRARGVERQQLKWLAWAMVPVTIGFSVGDYLPGSLKDLSTFVAVAALATAMGLAIFKYRLYDIDLVINRTLVYGTLTATLGSAYVLIVTVVGTVLEGSALVTAGATLAVAALFQPIRRHIQGFIDRRFYRRKYDAATIVEIFSSRLRDEVDLEAMKTQLLLAVRQTVQPQRVTVWLKP
jgi:hypothetical protein